MLSKELSEELNKRGFRYIWHNPKEDSVGRMCKFKERHSDTEYNPFADIMIRGH
jgi:hypothetical protein